MTPNLSLFKCVSFNLRCLEYILSMRKKNERRRDWCAKKMTWNDWASRLHGGTHLRRRLRPLKKKKSFMTDICTYLAMWIYECTFPPWFPLYLRMWKSFTVLQVMRHIINDCVLCISTKEGTLRWCPFEKMGSTMKNADIVFRGRAYTIKNRNVINAKIELRLCDDVSKCSTHSRP